jgi:ATP-dependent DNA ligase
VNLLTTETPASFVAFDLLALEDEEIAALPQSERRERLVAVFDGVKSPMHLTPATTDVSLARQWFQQFEGAGLDGIVAKPQHLAYRPDTRAMYKIKHERTADCVVGGFRWHKTSTDDKPLLGSMLLGLYDEQGALQHVGVCGSFSVARRAELAALLSPLQPEGLDGHPWADWAEAEGEGRRPGATSRWNAGKDLSWVPLRPELVVEVAYDHLQGNRFRHTTQFRRWRTDRSPVSCTYDQLEEPIAFDIAEVLD